MELQLIPYWGRNPSDPLGLGEVIGQEILHRSGTLATGDYLPEDNVPLMATTVRGTANIAAATLIKEIHAKAISGHPD